MDTKIQHDENTEYLVKEGATILDYASGFSNAPKHDGYIAIALVEQNGEVFVWWNFQTTDYKELAGRVARDEGESIFYAPKNGNWDSFDDNEEMARIEYNGMVALHKPGTGSIEECNEHIGNVLEFRGRRYGMNIHGDWEPNY